MEVFAACLKVLVNYGRCLQVRCMLICHNMEEKLDEKGIIGRTYCNLHKLHFEYCSGDRINEQRTSLLEPIPPPN